MMFKLKQLTWIIGCMLAVSGCSFMQKDRLVADIEIKPITRIKHANTHPSPKIMYLLGRYHQGKMNYPRAIAAYEKALESNPTYVEALNGLGVVYAIQGQRELSTEYFHKAIEISPEETYLYNNLGYALLTQGREIEAAAVLETALSLDPNNETAMRNLAMAHEKITLAGGNVGIPTAAPSISDFPENAVVANELRQENTLKSFDLTQHSHNEKTKNPALNHAENYPQVFEDVTPSTIIAQSFNHSDFKGTKIEISNGNGINGMARQVSEFFQHHGFLKARLTNHPNFTQNETEIYFRADNLEAAQQINQMLPKRAKLIETNQLRPDINVKVLLGRDFSGEKHYFSNQSAIQVSHDARPNANGALN